MQPIIFLFSGQHNSRGTNGVKQEPRHSSWLRCHLRYHLKVSMPSHAYCVSSNTWLRTFFRSVFSCIPFLLLLWEISSCFCIRDSLGKPNQSKMLSLSPLQKDAPAILVSSYLGAAVSSLIYLKGTKMIFWFSTLQHPFYFMLRQINASTAVLLLPL